MKVQVNTKMLRNLRDTAVRNGTVTAWTDLALEWAEQAERELLRMQKEAEQERDAARILSEQLQRATLP